MKSTFDKNAEKFVNLMVEKIESLSMNWQKPWFSKVNSKQNFLPQNLTGVLIVVETLFYFISCVKNIIIKLLFF